MKKYNFDLILTDEQLKENRLRTLKEDKDKRDNKLTLIIAIALLVLITLLLIHDNKNQEDLSKCENGTIQILTAREYDNQIETFCK